jgi:hypothetical protein
MSASYMEVLPVWRRGVAALPLLFALLVLPGCTESILGVPDDGLFDLGGGCQDCLDQPSDPDPIDDDPCTNFLAFNVGSCEEMGNSARDAIEGYFGHSGFRGSDANCVGMRDTLLATIASAGYMGSLNPENNYVGLADYGAPPAVWFAFGVIGSEWSLSERHRIVGHEAYHLWAQSSDEAMANAAAKYCFGYESNNPFGT